MDSTALLSAKPKWFKYLMRGVVGLTFVTAITVLSVTVGPHVVWMFKGKPAASHAVDAELGEHEAVAENGSAAHGEAPAVHGAATHGEHETSAVAHATDRETPTAHTEHTAVRGHEPKVIAVPGTVERIAQRYIDAWYSVQAKIDGLKRLELQNQLLALENAQLKQRLASDGYQAQAKQGEASTVVAKRSLAEKTGSELGRTIDQISYTPPELSSAQLLTLAVSYFKAREDEKAAVILHRLTESDDQTFRSPKVLTMAGVAWYRLDNFKLADEYFGRVLQTEAQASEETASYTEPGKEDALRYQAQARLWRGLVALKLGKETKAQFWFRELVDHHPHSTEANWVNKNINTEVSREPATSAKQHQEH